MRLVWYFKKTKPKQLSKLQIPLSQKINHCRKLSNQQNKGKSVELSMSQHVIGNQQNSDDVILALNEL